MNPLKTGRISLHLKHDHTHPNDIQEKALLHITGRQTIEDVLYYATLPQQRFIHYAETVEPPCFSSSKTLAKGRVLQLPCGTGKTLLSIYLIAYFRLPVIFSTSSEYLSKSFIKTLSEQCGMSEDDLDVCEDPCDCLQKIQFQTDRNCTTLSLPILVLTHQQLFGGDEKEIISKVKSLLLPYYKSGILIVDEGHQVPTTRCIPEENEFVKNMATICLTALFHKENNSVLEGLRKFLCGLVAFDASRAVELGVIRELTLAICPIRSPIPASQNGPNYEYIKQVYEQLRPFVTEIVERHKNILMLFVDVLEELDELYKFYEQEYGAAVFKLTREADTARRTFIRNETRHRFASKMGTIVICSRVGDCGYDLPEVSVGIEVRRLGSSFQQLTQRLGRFSRNQFLISPNMLLKAVFVCLVVVPPGISPDDVVRLLSGFYRDTVKEVPSQAEEHHQNEAAWVMYRAFSAKHSPSVPVFQDPSIVEPCNLRKLLQVGVPEIPYVAK